MSDLPASQFLLATVIALSLLLLIGWVAATVQTTRRSRALVAALSESSRGRVVLRRGLGAGGFSAAIEPPPEPFLQFTIDYRAASNLNIIALVLRPFTRGGDRLLLAGKLPTHAAAEIFWRRGGVPYHALARRARTTLWVQKRLDVIDAEFAVRGINTGAIEHVFVDLQARFGALLYQVSVQADDDPELRVLLATTRLEMHDVPALVTSLRALGRAALRG